jgi:hypothetical protein
MRVRRIPQTFESHNDARRTLPDVEVVAAADAIISVAGATMSARHTRNCSQAFGSKRISRQRRFLRALIPQGTEPPKDTPSSLNRVSIPQGMEHPEPGSASPANSTQHLPVHCCREQVGGRMPISAARASFSHSRKEVLIPKRIGFPCRCVIAPPDFPTGNKPEGSFEPAGVLSAWPLPLSRGSRFGELA